MSIVITAPDEHLVSSTYGVGKTMLKENLFLQAWSEDDSDYLLRELWGEFGIVSLFKQLGKYKSTKNFVLKYNYEGTLRSVHTLADNGTGVPNVVNNGDGTLTISTNENVQEFVPTDVIRAPNERHYQVVSASIVAGKLTYVVKALAGLVNVADWGSTPNMQISRLYNLQQECFVAPLARKHKWNTKEVRIGVLAARAAICDRPRNQPIRKIRVESEDGKVIDYIWDYEYAKVIRDMYLSMELYHLLGQRGDEEGENGIIPQIFEGGYIGVYQPPIQEVDLINFLSDISCHCKDKQFAVATGCHIMRDATMAVKDYMLNGGFNYGTYKDNHTKFNIGIGLDNYSFGSARATFFDESVFNDPTILPTNNGIGYDWQSMAVFMNLNDIDLVYQRAHNGQSMKFNIFKSNGYVPGAMAAANGNNYSIQGACEEATFSSYITQVVYNPRCHGALLAAA